MFETTDTGYRATDETVKFWAARDTCPSDGAVVSPARTIDGIHHYECDCNGAVRWTREV